MASARERLKEIFDNTIEAGTLYEGSLENLDHYSLFCKAASKNQLFKLFGSNVCMFNYTREGKDGILMVFFIPINSEDTGAKTVAERVMEIIRETEKCFITLDYAKSEEIKEEKFVYVTVLKLLNGG